MKKKFLINGVLVALICAGTYYGIHRHTQKVNRTMIFCTEVKEGKPTNPSLTFKQGMVVAMLPKSQKDLTNVNFKVFKDNEEQPKLIEDSNNVIKSNAKFIEIGYSFGEPGRYRIEFSNADNLQKLSEGSITIE